MSKAASLMIAALRGAVDCTGAGEGTSLPLDQVIENHSVQLSWSGTGTLSALIVALEGSLDGANFFALNTAHECTGAEITAKAALFHVTLVPVAYVRYNVTTITESVAGTVLLKILWCGC